jgi:acetyl-CoA carboxylase biotin carboxyl carrier protein
MKKIESNVGGQVAVIEVSVGSEVVPGDVLLVVESMKMEIPLESEQAGVVRAILVRPGDTVNEGQIVVELE